MAVQTNLCATCRDFVNEGHSDSIDDIGQHNEVSDEIVRLMGGRVHIDTGTTLDEAYKPCEFCQTVCDTLFTFNVKDHSIRGHQHERRDNIIKQ